MKDGFKGRRYSAEQHGPARPVRAADWTRLEEVGDLHFHASAYSSALDYYDQLLVTEALTHVEPAATLQVLRKAIDANILIVAGNPQSEGYLTGLPQIDPNGGAGGSTVYYTAEDGDTGTAYFDKAGITAPTVVAAELSAQ